MDDSLTGGDRPSRDDEQAGWSKPTWASPSPPWRETAHDDVPPPSPERSTFPAAFEAPRPYEGYGTGWVAPYGRYDGGDRYEGAYTSDTISANQGRRPWVVVLAAIAAVAVIAGAVIAYVTTRSPQPGPSAQPSGAATTPAPHPSPSAASPSPETTPTTSTGPLDGYLLPASAIGSGVRIVLISGGRDAVTEPTLDFCTFTYTSERDRLTRVQVRYEGGPQAVSEEFVRYKPGGAAKAFGELRTAISRCPSSYRDGDQTVGHIQVIRNTPGLVTDSVMLVFAVSYSDLGGPFTLWTAAVYQFDGDFFAGVYVYGADPQAVQRFAAQLGAKAAGLLREAAAGKPGTGGGTILNPSPTSPAGPGSQV
ncbi:MAG: hypothetical protein IRZ02_07865 [Acidothermus sp.]|nr:hypothetical protein [Acidothermus sp.]MCL6537811.1 hypothetical protein [Acidothermus sp.]